MGASEVLTHLRGEQVTKTGVDTATGVDMSSVKALDRYSCALWRASAEGLYSEALTKAVCADLCALHSCDCLIHNNFGSTKVAPTAPLGVTPTITGDCVPPTLTGEDNGFSLETTVKAFTLNAEAKEFVPSAVTAESSAPCDSERLSRRSAMMASIKACRLDYEAGRTLEQVHSKARCDPGSFIPPGGVKHEEHSETPHFDNL